MIGCPHCTGTGYAAFKPCPTCNPRARSVDWNQAHRYGEEPAPAPVAPRRGLNAGFRARIPHVAEFEDLTGADTAEIERRVAAVVAHARRCER